MATFVLPGGSFEINVDELEGEEGGTCEQGARGVGRGGEKQPGWREGGREGGRQGGREGRRVNRREGRYIYIYNGSNNLHSRRQDTVILILFYFSNLETYQNLTSMDIRAPHFI